MEIKLTNKRILQLLPINARELSLSGEIEPIIGREKDKEGFDIGGIQSLTYDGKKQFKLNDKFEINNIKYVINSIEKLNNKEYTLVDTYLNKSALFLLPLVTEPNNYAGNYLVNYCLYNTYLYYPGYRDGNFLFLCYKFLDNPTYKKLEEKLINHSNFIEIIEKGIFTIFVLEIDKKYNFIIDQFIEGKYHDFHDVVKHKITSFYDLNNNAGITAYIKLFKCVDGALYNREESRKKVERELYVNLPNNINWLSKPDINNETFKL